MNSLIEVLKLLERVNAFLRRSEFGGARSDLSVVLQTLSDRSLDPVERMVLRPPVHRMKSILSCAPVPPAIVASFGELESRT